MPLINKRDVVKVVHPHYIFNILLALAFPVLKTVSPFCEYLFNVCELDNRESQILFFTVIVIFFRTRKQGAVSFLPYLSMACMFTKLASILLFFTNDPLYGVIYTLLAFLHLFFLPEPTYTGPENIAYFKSGDLEEEIEGDKRVVWLVEMYTSWSPPCIDFSNVFSELSNKYSLDNLRFAKIDLARNDDAATKYKINTSSFSLQLPTLIMFKNGKEFMRRPIVNDNCKLVKFAFSYDNVVAEYDLNNVYEECKKNPLKKETKLKTN